MMGTRIEMPKAHPARDKNRKICLIWSNQPVPQAGCGTHSYGAVPWWEWEHCPASGTFWGDFCRLLTSPAHLHRSGFLTNSLPNTQFALFWAFCFSSSHLTDSRSHVPAGSAGQDGFTPRTRYLLSVPEGGWGNAESCPQYFFCSFLGWAQAGSSPEDLNLVSHARGETEVGSSTPSAGSGCARERGQLRRSLRVPSPAPSSQGSSGAPGGCCPTSRMPSGARGRPRSIDPGPGCCLSRCGLLRYACQ